MSQTVTIEATGAFDPERRGIGVQMRACKAVYNGDESSLAQMLDSLLEEI